MGGLVEGLSHCLKTRETVGSPRTPKEVTGDFMCLPQGLAGHRWA